MPTIRFKAKPYPIDVIGAIPTGMGSEYEAMLISSHDAAKLPAKSSGAFSSSKESGLERVVALGPTEHTDIRDVADRMWLKLSEAIGSAKAMELLARLYEAQVLTPSDLGRTVGAKTAFALAMLAAADLCDVDEYAARIAPRGKKLVEDLVEAGKTN